MADHELISQLVEHVVAEIRSVGPSLTEAEVRVEVLRRVGRHDG